MRTHKEIEYLIFILIFLNIIAKSTFIFFSQFLFRRVFAFLQKHLNYTCLPPNAPAFGVHSARLSDPKHSCGSLEKKEKEAL